MKKQREANQDNRNKKGVYARRNKNFGDRSSIKYEEEGR